MKKIFTYASVWTTAAVFLAISTLPALAAAAPTNPSQNGQALEIAPPVINLNANPGQSIKTLVYLRNVSSGNLIVTGQANDFVAAGQDGTPKLILKDEGSNPYSLKKWVGPLPSLLTVPREVKTMPVTINVPPNASPGGHYGVIRFTATPPEMQGTGVSLSASLGALVLVTVSGKINESLAVQDFSVNHNGKTGTVFESTPLQFIERFKNNGNVHVKPTGQVSITNMFGKKIAAVNVNLPPGNVLPASIRKFDQPLDKSVLGNKKLFGRYKANLQVTYGNDKKVLTASLAFWVIPYRLIAVAAIILVAGFFTVRRLVRAYNRRIIAKAQHRR